MPASCGPRRRLDQRVQASYERSSSTRCLRCSWDQCRCSKTIGSSWVLDFLYFKKGVLECPGCLDGCNSIDAEYLQYNDAICRSVASDVRCDVWFYECIWLQFRPGDAWALFTQLDRDGDAEVNVDEFLEGCMLLKGLQPQLTNRSYLRCKLSTGSLTFLQEPFCFLLRVDM